MSGAVPRSHSSSGNQRAPTNGSGRATKHRVRGRGLFGRHSSNVSWALFRVTSDEEVTLLKRWMQRCEATNQWKRPYFKPAELTRMKDKAVEYHRLELEGGQLTRDAVRILEADPNKHHHVKSCELCNELGHPCTNVLTDVVGNVVQLSPPEMRLRGARLRDGDVITGFHQTDAAAAEAIQAEGFKPGESGAFGGGIYFATSVADTDRKATRHPVVLKCLIRVGRVRRPTALDHSMSGPQMLTDRYDSVYYTGFSSGPEWVVYFDDQIVPGSIEVVPR